jgi:D-alanyl-D-alanine dipeptidase
MAVDVTILDPSGRELDMGTAFDDMTELSHPKLEAEHVASGELTAAQIANRQLLRDAMFGAGFVGINSEWWHFDCGDRVQVRATYAKVL